MLSFRRWLPFVEWTLQYFIVCALLSVGPGVRLASALPPAAGALAQAIQADGTLRPGTAGSFDARGYRLRTAPDGRPVFLPAAAAGAGDQQWQEGFYAPGIVGYVNAIVASGAEVYVGGSFSVAGNVQVQNVAKWDGAAWHALGAGVSMEVYALAVNGTDVYAGGQEIVNSSFVGKVAKWNGTTWATMGTPMGSGVTALALTATGTLYAGRYFTSGGMVTQWSGTAWSIAGGGQLNGGVRALATNGADLYVGGDFTQANGLPANYIAKLNGSAWSPLGAGLDNQVWALAFQGNDLYVGGRFYSAGATPARNMARWDGTAWHALGTGITSPNGAVHAMASSGSDLYVCGQFGAAGGAVANNLAKWDGTTWSDLGAGPSYAFRALALAGPNLYLGGQFTQVGGVGATGIAKRSAGNWRALGTGLNDAVYALAVRGNDIYVAGSFIQAGGLPARHIAKWNGTTWSTLGTGPANGTDGNVQALAVAGNGDVYVGGNFAQAGGTAAAYIARWNGTTWSSVGIGVNGPVLALAAAGNGDVYAGGAFSQAGGLTVNYVARWDGVAWSALGSGVAGRTSPGQSVYVSMLAVRNGEVYIGGSNFTSAGGVPVRQLARWNGSGWSDMGFLATTGTVYALAASGTLLYVGGNFSAISGVLANSVATWDGTTWSAVGAGLTGYAETVAVQGPDVYATGRFAGSSGVGLAHWDGTTWQLLGTGLDHLAWALVVAANGDVAVGGLFSGTADHSRTSRHFGVYRAGLVTAASKVAPVVRSVVYPNPARRVATLQLSGNSSIRSVCVVDALGRVVRRQLIPAQATAVRLDLTDLVPGAYTVHCGTVITRLVVE